MVSVAAKDFSFMVENNIRDIFDILHRNKIKVNLIQNSAISFSVCVEDKYRNFDRFIEDISKMYTVNYSSDVCLYTIRHATLEAVNNIEIKGQVLLKQATRETVQIVMR